MKARIEKKLSKRLLEIVPSLFRGAWIDSEEPSELAWKQGSRVSHVWSIGGEVDYWGEGSDWYSLWSVWASSDCWCWHGGFPAYPAGHKHGGYPDTTGFKPTTQNLLKLAAEAERKQGDQP